MPFLKRAKKGGHFADAGLGSELRRMQWIPVWEHKKRTHAVFETSKERRSFRGCQWDIVGFSCMTTTQPIILT